MTTYQNAGIDLNVKAEVSDWLKGQLGTGLFGGFVPVFQLKDYDEPVLVSSIDGVGTKVALALELGCIDGLGADIVHHCVNDIAVHGASPLFFLDYIACHHLDRGLVERLVNSISTSCQALGIRLAGGETAEMPMVYGLGRVDIAGAVVGVAERRAIVDGSGIELGDVLMGIASSGIHTNGFSLLQAIFSEDDYRRYEPSLGRTLGEALLEPHRCYLTEVKALLMTGKVRGLAHITGGGMAGNLERIMPDGLEAIVDLPDGGPLFGLISGRGVPRAEMRRVFNLGTGLVAVCSPEIRAEIPDAWYEIGTVIPAADRGTRVRFVDEV